MDEAIPVLVGVAIAFGGRWLPPFNGKGFMLTLVAALLGMAWTVTSGEAARHWIYLLIDAAQAVVALWVFVWMARRWSIGPASREVRP
jgi:hypothetical protein